MTLITSNTTAASALHLMKDSVTFEGCRAAYMLFKSSAKCLIALQLQAA